MRIIAVPLGYLLTWLYEFVGSYGLTLIIFTVAIKLAMYPLYAKQIKSTAGMAAMQPKIQEIQQKYSKDQALMNEKLQELYQKEGFSMYNGCLPMIIQMVIIMGLFALLRNPMNYIESEQMLLAIHESFLWIPDLAQPDKWILPIISGVATFIAFAFSQTSQPGANAAQAKIMTNMMKYFFPVMILLMARSYPAGLAIYWAGSQVVQIFYNLRFKKLKKKIAEQSKTTNVKKKKPVRA